jgi:phage tail sheath protein FI
MSTYSTPGIYTEEVSVFPPSVAAVSTAIPAFVGYTEKGPANSPTRITSMVEYEDTFGGAFKAQLLINDTVSPFAITSGANKAQGYYKMYYSLQMYFANGGGPAYIVSVDTYTNKEMVPAVIAAVEPDISPSDVKDGIDSLEFADEPTLIVIPDLGSLGSDTDLKITNFYSVFNHALDHCAKMGDRFTIIDTHVSVDELRSNNNTTAVGITSLNVSYGAAYWPNVNTLLTHAYREDVVVVQSAAATMDTLTATQNSLYNAVISALNANTVELPSSPIIAGIYATTDRTRGVWKAPANAPLANISGPVVAINDAVQAGMNIDAGSGLSVNAIRSFVGRGPLVWGARTLAGNDNEWRYISVRRFFLMVEESVGKASSRYVFEPNSAPTWVKVKGMISNFLTNQWKAGALLGDRANDAFYVKVGLGQTMTQQDVLDGKMIIEIGMAAVRPAEFIILRFSHKMLDA